MSREEIHKQIAALLKNADDKTRSQAEGLHGYWYAGKYYEVGEVVDFEGSLYRCLTSHSAQETWKPDVSPSLWVRIMYREGIRIIPDVIEATAPFMKNEQGWWGADLYRCLMDYCVHTPEQYPAAWEKAVTTE